MTLLQELQDAGTPRPPSSPWSFARPDGPLAEALRRAQAQRALSGPPATQEEAGPPSGALVTEPLAPPPSPPPELLAEDIEALAREARARDDVREAMALALEWPAQAPAPRKPWAMPRWIAWLGLAGVIALAVAAALAAFPPEPGTPGAASKPRADGLRLERQLAVPPRP